MALTTPPRPFDLLKDFPELGPYAKPAVRLHPRQGTPTVEQSSIGGPLLWPADEEWPLCFLDHEDYAIEPYDPELRQRFEDGKAAWMHGRKGLVDFNAQMAHVQRLAIDLVTEAGTVYGPDDPTPLIPVAQLFARDVPGLPFTDQFDLLQILWCPRDHLDTRNQAPYCPAFQVRWARTDTIGEVLTSPPTPELCADPYVLNPCVVHPEIVTEYPDIRTLPEPLKEALIDWHQPEGQKARGQSTVESFDTAQAPGWKAMGHGMYWGIIDPFLVECECGTEQLPLFTADSSEFDGGTGSWRPAEKTGRGRHLSNPVDVMNAACSTARLSSTLRTSGGSSFSAPNGS